VGPTVIVLSLLASSIELARGLGVRHALFPTLTLGAPLRGCQLPDAILHGKRSFRPHSRAVQRLAVVELLSEASWLASTGVCGRRLANQVKTRM